MIGMRRVGSVLLLAGCVGLVGCDEKLAVPTPTPPPSPVTVSIVPGARSLTTTAFSPNPLNIARGTTVTWINNDTSTHAPVADGGAFDAGNIAPGSEASFTFQNAGTFPYHCGRHPGMVATVNVQ
jgi:plastocyanin